MTNDDPMYVKHLERALAAAELEIKGLEDDLHEQGLMLIEIQQQLNPTHMGEPLVCAQVAAEKCAEDAARYRWITRAARQRELRIPATESKQSIDAAIDGQRLKQAHKDAEESEAERQAMYGTFQGA